MANRDPKCPVCLILLLSTGRCPHANDSFARQFQHYLIDAALVTGRNNPPTS